MSKKPVVIDESVIKAAIAGKSSAYHTIYRKTHGRLFVICYRYAHDIAEANDWCQEAYLKLFANLHKFKNESSSFITWAHSLFRNYCIDQFRRKGIQKNIPIDYYDNLPVDINDPSFNNFTEDEAQEFIKMKAEVLLDLVQTKLNDLERTVFNMYVIDGIMQKEISEELKINSSTIRGIYLRARTKLKKNLKYLQINRKY